MPYAAITYDVKPGHEDEIAELFANFQRADTPILHNEDGGYLLRTKGDQSEEGGVAAGFGSMDSVSLV